MTREQDQILDFGTIQNCHFRAISNENITGFGHPIIDGTGRVVARVGVKPEDLQPSRKSERGVTLPIVALSFTPVALLLSQVTPAIPDSLNSLHFGSPDSSSQLDSCLHVIQPGDTLSQLAATFNTTPEHIRELNPNEVGARNLILSGHVLFFDSSCEPPYAIGGQLKEGTKHLASEIFQGASFLTIGEELPGTVVYPFEVNDKNGRYTVNYKNGAIVKEVYIDREFQRSVVVIARKNGKEELYWLDNVLIKVGQKSAVESMLENKKGMFSPSFQALPESDKKQVLHLASQILNGGKTKYYWLLDAIFNPKGEEIPVERLTAKQVVDTIADYRDTVENNTILLEMNKRIEGVLVPINKLTQNLLSPNDFINGQVPIVTREQLGFAIFPGGKGWSGGQGPNFSGNSPARIYGSYGDKAKLSQEYQEAFKSLTQVEIHELVVHGALQGESISAPKNIQFIENPNGEVMPKDWKTFWAHEASGIWEYAVSRSVGIETNYPSWRVFHLFDRMTSVGFSPREVLKLILNASVYGVTDEIEIAYKKGMRSSDPSLQDMFEKLAAPSEPVSGKSLNLLIQTVSHEAGLEFPPKIMSFSGPENYGNFRIPLKPAGLSSPMNPLGFELNFTFVYGARTMEDIEAAKEDPNNLSLQYSAAFQLAKADPEIYKKIKKIWLEKGEPDTMTYSELKKALEIESPDAYGVLEKMEEGPKLDLAQDGKKRELNIIIPPSRWETGPNRQVVCFVPLKEPWFMPLASFDSLPGSVAVGRLYMDGGKLRADNCPADPNVRIGYWNNRKFVEVARWEETVTSYNSQRYKQQ